MSNVNQDRFKKIIHRRMQLKFNRHREALERHKEKSPFHAAAVEDLERKLFGVEEPPSV